jgi:rSAM/selenodomain-associated transferase 1
MAFLEIFRMTYKYQDAVIMIFCKAPVPGHVKTRLMTELSAAEAAEIHIELSTRTLQLAAESRLCPVQLWCAPTTEHHFFTTTALNYSVSLHQQLGTDLGQKMHRAFCSALNLYASALIMGCDCPSLTEQDLEQALAALVKPQSCVLAPAEDGGYVLIGLNQPHSELLDNISWGTEQVFEQTRTRINKSTLNYFELKQQWDVDTPEDLARYRASTQLKPK